MSSVELEIPALSPYVGVVRLALAALARAAGLDEERVDDLKIAVSEACSRAVLAEEAEGSGSQVAVTWSDEADRIVIEVSDHSGGPAESADTDNSLSFSARAVMSEALLRSLVDGYESTTTPDGTTTTRLLINH